ncbi:hypothetical protein Pint_29230 [Pistacia integerrima]|uniref:Uncharacterized protein n=1 Tax=Pistacia integerrima TaxID=434235 RepID=A0ACC0X3Q7_9ROSI|nr:hypothetical protein Pint_29230 [Pistacia integerrima]
MPLFLESAFWAMAKSWLDVQVDLELAQGHYTTICECMCPDATICAAVMSALYSTVSEEVVLNCQLMVNVSISSSNNYCIEVVLHCLAVEGDGLGSHDLNDGGILGTVMAAGFKGELVRFQPGVSVSLVESGNEPERHDELIELVASSETGFLHLFSQQQLQLEPSDFSFCAASVDDVSTAPKHGPIEPPGNSPDFNDNGDYGKASEDKYFVSGVPDVESSTTPNWEGFLTNGFTCL